MATTNPIIKFFKGLKTQLSLAPKESGAVYIATGGNNAHAYYSDGNSFINIAPSFVESQTNEEIVITFER